MNLYDAQSYFDRHFVPQLEDPAAVTRQLHAHRAETDTHESVREAILVLAAYAQWRKRTRKQSKAARTLAGETFLRFINAAGGTCDYGKLNYEGWRTHRRTRRATERVLEQLETDGIIDVTHPTYPDRDRPMVARIIDVDAFTAEQS